MSAEHGDHIERIIDQIKISADIDPGMFDTIPHWYLLYSQYAYLFYDDRILTEDEIGIVQRIHDLQNNINTDEHHSDFTHED
jgi:hypothetical protein